MASMKTSPSLVNFFIYNSTFGPKEGMEKEKIILYIPTGEELDKKIKNIGLCEALVKFTETFSPEKPCNSLHTQKTRQVFFEAEPEFWMIMTVSIPFSEKMTKDGKMFVEYHDEDVLDSVLDGVLKQAYKMFKTYNIEALCKRLEHFYTSYLQTLNFSQFNLLDVFSGINFLPLDKNTFLRIQSFINVIEHTFSQVRYTSFLYSEKLVWSGLEQEDMRILYKYLVTSLFPSTIDLESMENPRSQGYVIVQPKPHHGRFITGPTELDDVPIPRTPPKIFVNTDSEQEELILVVYKALEATICLMISGSYPTLDFFRKIDNFIGPQLTTLANIIGEQSAKKQQSSDQQYRYLYFNHMNLAQKSSVHSKKSSLPCVAPEIMRLMGDISADFASFQEDGETFVKTMSDCWIVGRKSDQRELFVILNQKSANLIEIDEEVKRLGITQFNNIFFLD
ncbi:vacuolar fusion protein CCZ1 homolog isoform X2 [Pocillopora damicornis]|uniref:vacuolar fusion protein CCZ1 homolog isoform X2 n=1 Tax=Pocillopora damicornis TaxID=46731 RepID=UPI000F54D179|nr:vacuolar fusion protein CCZ1 homolog isoform X2 [Pocillopora damicornis]